MRYLIDTNGWTGFFGGEETMGKHAKNTMSEESGDCCVSIASVWEASIKVGLGKLKLPYDVKMDLPRLLEENGFEVLPIEVEDALAVRDLEAVHGDPFDRMQVVQAQRRGYAVVSRDAVFERYGLRRVWG